MERFNRTLDTLLRTFAEGNPRDRTSHLPLIKLAYNSSRQESIGLTPFEALYGIQPTLPKDVQVYLFLERHAVYEDGAPGDGYLAEFGARLRTVRDLARDHLRLAEQTQALEYNRRHRVQTELEVGNQVLLHVAKFPRGVRRAKKLFFYWDGPSCITEKQ